MIASRSVAGDEDVVEPRKAAKVSFCSTCKGRLWQLRRTFPENFAAIEADGCSEMVLVNYNSEDGLDEWIRHFRSAIEAGTLRYVHERSDPYFHVSKAKNLAHLAATGEFVVNLDADNFIGDTIARYRRFWEDNPDIVIHGFCGGSGDGTYGRIGMAKRHFLELGGYDEEMLPMGNQDCDLLRRAHRYGLDFLRLVQKGVPAIRNDNIEKVRYTGSHLTFEAMEKLNAVRLKEGTRTGRIVANRERQRRPVLINFSAELDL